MHVHILGICGTFMGGIAAIAKASGHRVSGSDENAYPPMSDQLRELGIAVREGYHPNHLNDDIDCVIVGNVMSRGNPMVEALLNSSLAYRSGPRWLAEHVLKDRWVLAVAGTHGKTTTSSLLAWILDYAGLEPGFLIGGVPVDFGVSARLGGSRYFVVEADEYDTAFFDKRAKFVHYRPRTLAITNIEYDHADIYDDMGAILRQFHHLLRTVPGRGRVAVNGRDGNVEKLLAQGIWTPVETFSAVDHGSEWFGRGVPVESGSRFSVCHRGEHVGQATWRLLGKHNVENALAAIACAADVGVPVVTSLEALSRFRGVKRRLEKRGEYDGVALYDDFAHHPTAVRATLGALRNAKPDRRIVAVLEPGSNTMRMGIHRGSLGASLEEADKVFVLISGDLEWDAESVLASLGDRLAAVDLADGLLLRLLDELRPGDQVALMSNRGFQGLPGQLQEALSRRAAPGASPGAEGWVSPAPTVKD